MVVHPVGPVTASISVDQGKTWHEIEIVQPPQATTDLEGIAAVEGIATNLQQMRELLTGDLFTTSISFTLTGWLLRLRYNPWYKKWVPWTPGHWQRRLKRHGHTGDNWWEFREE